MPKDPREEGKILEVENLKVFGNITLVKNANPDRANNNEANISFDGTDIVKEENQGTIDPIGGGGNSSYVVSAQYTPQDVPPSGQYGSAVTDAVALTLDPGTYDLTLMVDFAWLGNIISKVAAGIGTVIGDNNTGLNIGENYLQGLPPTADADVGIVIPSYRVVITEQTTYYLKIFCSYSGTAPLFLAKLEARSA